MKLLPAGQHLTSPDFPGLRQVPGQVEIINDWNGELTNVYWMVQFRLEEFVLQFKCALSSKQLFKWHQESRPNTLTDVQRAARFYYLQHHAFGGQIEGQTFGTATTAPAINLLRIEETLSAAHRRLASGTTVENLPWKDDLERYDRPHTFVYADPPYWQTEDYSVPFPFEEYLSMAEATRTMKGKMMVSINDHPDIRRAFEGLHMMELEIMYSVGAVRAGRTASRELVITNWEPDALGQLF